MLSVVNLKGGVGRTSISGAILDYAVRHGRSVAVLDADPSGALARWCASAWPRVPVVRAKPSTDPRGEIIRAAREAADLAELVLADGPPAAVDVVRALVSLSDLVVVPTTAGPEDILQARATLDLCVQEGELRREPIPTLLVWNRVQPRTRLDSDALLEVEGWGTASAQARVHHRVAWAVAVADGMPLSATPGEAAQEAEALATEILAVLPV